MGGKSVRVPVALHIWNYLHGTLVAKWSFQTFKRPISDWFGPTYKCKISSYMDNSRVLLGST